MRLLVLLSLVAFASLLVPLGLFTASDAECPAQGAAAANAPGLILQQSEGDRKSAPTLAWQRRSHGHIFHDH